ncbi:MAG: exopolysaccharide biosynthesis polyprenyl glycosylphosphotransferase, partial [Inhella sp.]|uniref:exopolysaccharide biosynthesis polyprenyl glycosylphosphotransferase n=1 Tax=Inhella sp. TaxID=1921806 RepID=UPI00391F8CA0
MRVFNHYLQRRSLMQVIFDVGLIVAVLLFTVLALGGGETLPVAAAQSLSLAGVLFVVNSATGLYQPAPKRTLTQVCMRGIVALMFALPITFLVLQWLPVGGEDAFWVSATAMAAVAAVVMHRALASRALQSSVSRNRVLVLGAGPAAWDVAQSLREADPLTEIIGFYPGASETEVSVDARELVSTELPLSDTALRLGADEIVVALSERRGGNTPLRELLDCKVVGIRVVDLATHFEKNLHQISLKHVNAGWLVFGDGFNQTAFRSGVKRAFDLVCSAVLLVVSAPAMLVAAMAVKLESPGPVFYRQERVGLNGVPFMVTKFRSMRNDAEKDGRPVWATKNDARVTRVGKFIRKTRIDELPQLFNVLRGDMSLVGPRPERAFFVEQLIQKIPYFA